MGNQTSAKKHHQVAANKLDNVSPRGGGGGSRSPLKGAHVGAIRKAISSTFIPSSDELQRRGSVWMLCPSSQQQSRDHHNNQQESRESSEDSTLPTGGMDRQKSFKSKSQTSLNRSGGGLELSYAQLALVKRAWRQMRAKGSNEPGLSVYQHLCLRSHEIREVFHYSELAGEGQQGDDVFYANLKQHAFSLTSCLDKLFEQLDQDHMLAEWLLDVGKAHSKLRNCGFKPSHLDELANALTTCSTEWGDRQSRCQEAQEAWVSIIFGIIGKIKEGYSQEIRRLRKESVIRRKLTPSTLGVPEQQQSSVSPQSTSMSSFDDDLTKNSFSEIDKLLPLPAHGKRNSAAASSIGSGSVSKRLLDYSDDDTASDIVAMTTATTTEHVRGHRLSEPEFYIDDSSSLSNLDADFDNNCSLHANKQQQHKRSIVNQVLFERPEYE